MKFNMDAARMYLRWLVGLVLGGIVSTGKAPWLISAHEWSLIANTIWASALPVLVAWANKNHPLTLTVPDKTE